MSNTLRIAIIGAGPSGITAAQNLKAAGFRSLVIFDRGTQVGGNWVFDATSGHSSVFETTHIISSREYSQYEDFPMPKEYPDYPSHSQLASYFQAYARHFELEPLIRFQTTVESCTREADGSWLLRVRNAEGALSEERFDHLVVANGHHWEPRMPEYPGQFTGRLIHSHHYKRAEPFRSERILVIGGGNSACDVAVETSRVSARTDLSWRRGYRIVPKFIFGVPGDRIYNWALEKMPFLPRKLRWGVMRWLLDLLNGPNRLYGLPEPDHDFGETHPTVNSELLYFIRHGRIRPRPDVARWDGKTVHFKDGTISEYDTVIACTGFVIRHPFFAPDLIDYSHGPVPLYLRMFHPRFENLTFIGLVQPIGCIWPLAELQSKLLAKKLLGHWQPPLALDQAIESDLREKGVPQIGTPRHTITVEYPVFKKQLLRELSRSRAP